MFAKLFSFFLFVLSIVALASAYTFDSGNAGRGLLLGIVLLLMGILVCIWHIIQILEDNG